MINNERVPISDELEVPDPDGLTSVVLRWRPEHRPRAVLQVLHGWCEHAGRYERLAAALAEDGFAVYADDHRGHGQTGLRSATLGDLGPRGAAGVLDAIRAVTGQARADYPDLPLFILGHSWGSFLLQGYLRQPPPGLAGAVLTGTTYRAPGTRRERADPNARFEPARTPYDWLSRDPAEVDRYVADPLCGFEITQATGARPGSLPDTDNSGVPRALPVLILNGSDDPVGGTAGGQQLAGHYRSLGLADVTFRAYPGARHELLNETNRDEVQADLRDWLGARLPPAAGA
ncbi:MAG TPA: alpha/beta fold hydrolase [Streptosporangiaceae bacterium]|jgi:alpha-beta hydrolase superfamily lysophospholipase